MDSPAVSPARKTVTLHFVMRDSAAGFTTTIGGHGDRDVSLRDVLRGISAGLQQTIAECVHVGLHVAQRTCFSKSDVSMSIRAEALQSVPGHIIVYCAPVYIYL